MAMGPEIGGFIYFTGVKFSAPSPISCSHSSRNRNSSPRSGVELGRHRWPDLPNGKRQRALFESLSHFLFPQGFLSLIVLVKNLGQPEMRFPFAGMSGNILAR
jgi:hypothetical protein